MTSKTENTQPTTQQTEDPAVVLFRAERERKEAERKARLAARKEAKEGNGPRRLASGRLSASGLPCLCGCEAPTHTREARFLSGHDQRMRVGILKQGLAVSAIPSEARPFFEEGAVAGLLLVDAGTATERLVDVKQGGRDTA